MKPFWKFTGGEWIYRTHETDLARVTQQGTHSWAAHRISNGTLIEIDIPFDLARIAAEKEFRES